jgi:hypothetical protein
MKKQKNENLEIKKEIYKFMYFKGYIYENTCKFGPYKTIWGQEYSNSTNPFAEFARDLYLIFKDGKEEEIKELTKEINQIKEKKISEKPKNQ